LTPDDVLGIWIHVQVLLQLLPGERIQLLNTRDGGVTDFLGCAMLMQCSVDLTSAEDDSLNVFGFIN
jgi:hypothetical protein